MKKVARNFKAGITANNRYAGFGPGTVNIFRQLLGLGAKWEDEYVMTIDNTAGKENDNDHSANLIKTEQTVLSDFL